MQFYVLNRFFVLFLPALDATPKLKGGAEKAFWNILKQSTFLPTKKGQSNQGATRHNLNERYYSSRFQRVKLEQH
jgi:hypothetical protein